MLKKIFGCLFFLFCITISYSSLSCPSALPTNNPDFCQSFKLAASCYCTSSGLPNGMCSNMSLLYQRMISTLRSLENACRFQHNTSTQECIDDWVCYRNGGQNSLGELCSGTGSACE